MCLIISQTSKQGSGICGRARVVQISGQIAAGDEPPSRNQRYGKQLPIAIRCQGMQLSVDTFRYRKRNVNSVKNKRRCGSM